MTSICKYLGVLLAAAFITATAPGADAPAAKPAGTNGTAKIEDLFPDTVVAKGKNVEIKRSRLDEEIASMRASLAARGQQITAAELPQVEKMAYDHLLQIQLLLTKATDADKTKGAAEGEKRLAMIKQRIAANSGSTTNAEELLAGQLKAMNLTMDQLRARLAEEASAEQVLRDKVSVSDEAVKKFFDENPADFEEPEMIHGYHILLATTDKKGQQISEDDRKAKKKLADSLAKRIKDGEDFAKVAREFSEDPAAKTTGGEFTLPRGRMPMEFASAAFSLQTNQVSDVVTSQLGFHIIKLIEKIPAKKMEFAKETTDIRDFLEGQEMKKLLPDVSAQLIKDANVQVLDEELKKNLAAAAMFPNPGEAPVAPVAPAPK